MRTEDEPSSESKVKRKVYEAPRVEESGTFQQLVLACGTLPGTPCDDDPLGRPTYSG